MKRVHRIVLAVATATIFLAPAVVAQPAPTTPGRPPVAPTKTAPPLTTSKGGPAERPMTGAAGAPVGGLAAEIVQTPTPKVTVAALTSNARCEVRVLLRNEGPALPDSITEVTYTVSRPLGLPSITQTVPAEQLRAAGSRAIISVPALKTTYAPASFTASARTGGAVSPAITNTLTCAETRPNLVLDIVYEQDCSKRLVVRNVGGDLPSPNNSVAFHIRRQIDGWTYRPLASLSGLRSGDTFEAPDLRSFESSVYHVGKPADPPGTAITEAPPSKCRGPKPDYRVALANVDVDASCYPTVTVQNLGAPLPAGLRFPVDFMRDGVSKRVDFESRYMPTGARTDVRARDRLGAAVANFKISLEPPTGRIGPKIISLDCPHAR